MCKKNKSKKQKKFEQYQNSALNIQYTLLELNLEQNEMTFQLAKKITIDRQISDICVSGDESAKTYPLRIIKDMTYEEYTTLTKTIQNINCSSEKIDSTQY